MMDRRPWSRAELKMRCLARIAEATLREAERRELVNCVQTYLQLTSSEAGELPLPGKLGPQRSSNMPQSLLFRMSWLDKAKLEGERQGVREVLLGMMEERFGSVPAETRRRVEEIQSVDRLKRLCNKVWTAKTMKGLRLS